MWLLDSTRESKNLQIWLQSIIFLVATIKICTCLHMHIARPPAIFCCERQKTDRSPPDFFHQNQHFLRKIRKPNISGKCVSRFYFLSPSFAVLANHISRNALRDSRTNKWKLTNENRFRTTFCSCNAPKMGVFGPFFAQIWENDGFRTDDGTFFAMSLRRSISMVLGDVPLSSVSP